MATFKNKAELLAAVASGAVSQTKHPTCDLWIYNYTRGAIQAGDSKEAAWESPTLRQCRGIIADKDLNIAARPFEKFFNYEELEASPELARMVIPEGTFELPCEISEKLDGSLGIMYWPTGSSLPALATRSTFTSEQAEVGTSILRTKYADVVESLPRDKTFLFEIIYPANKLVVNYGQTTDVYLLAVIDTETGREEDSSAYPFPRPAQYGSDWRGIRNEFEESGDARNKEGFVVKFANGVRVKLKFAEYFRLHYLAGKLSRKNMIAMLSAGQEAELRKMCEDVANGDEEALLYFTDEINKLLALRDWHLKAARDMTKYQEDFPTAKDWADYVRRQGRFAPLIFLFARQPRLNLAGRQVGKQFASMAQARRELRAIDQAAWRLVADYDEPPSELQPMV